MHYANEINNNIEKSELLNYDCAPCNDNNSYTENDIYTDGICAGNQILGNSMSSNENIEYDKETEDFNSIGQFASMYFPIEQKTGKVKINLYYKETGPYCFYFGISKGRTETYPLNIHLGKGSEGSNYIKVNDGYVENWNRYVIIDLDNNTAYSSLLNTTQALPDKGTFDYYYFVLSDGSSADKGSGNFEIIYNY